MTKPRYLTIELAPLSDDSFTITARSEISAVLFSATGPIDVVLAALRAFVMGIE